jgi:hypothetical protein
VLTKTLEKTTMPVFWYIFMAVICEKLASNYQGAKEQKEEVNPLVS